LFGMVSFKHICFWSPANPKIPPWSGIAVCGYSPNSDWNAYWENVRIEILSPYRHLVRLRESPVQLFIQLQLLQRCPQSLCHMFSVWFTTEWSWQQVMLYFICTHLQSSL
jgi:hypothetical protein